MRCPHCGAANPASRKFCGNCGTRLVAVCGECGAPAEAGQRFCGDCGAALLAAPQPGAADGLAHPSGAAAAPVAERRVVSVLFADLVGSTTLAEGRDAEDVRDLLSRYFDACRAVIERYGGAVEKFIGDAVMAVWGAPAAHEDDPERAVRAALDLVAAVAALGVEAGVPELAARAGVVTGPVAVTLGASGQGMVAGDTVNTASRVQGAAPPGGVLVDEATRSATMAAIGYADAGMHELKGKTAAVRLFRATRVVAAVGGAQRVDGLEAPFVGRDRELRLVKDLFHATAETGRARLVAVTGVAGVGKSRLGWEFFKYIDGLASVALWHAGRCLPYGDGVAFWALAEMVRMRCRISESDAPGQQALKLSAMLTEYVPAEADRAWLTPRLAALVGLTELIGGLTFAREELFGAWRLLFESLARNDPVILVVEDLQWADAGLLDFLDHLLDWSRDYPVYVLTFARPELEERRPGWGGGRRNATPLYLEALPDAAMRDLVDGLVADLPPAVRDAIVKRADGLPLYAVETVRMLIDRDLVVPREGMYVLAVDAAERLARADLADLGVPASLAALIAARLDALPPPERRLVNDAAVLGVSFSRASLAALTGVDGDDLDTVLRSLVRKEILTVTADPRSPDAGQYRFVQPVVRMVAYEILSRHDRKARHLAVATRLAADWSDADEIADVLADHYRAAFDAGPTDVDAETIRSQALAAYVRAGDRAVKLGAPDHAVTAYRTAVSLAADDRERADLTAKAGHAALAAGMNDAAVSLLEDAISQYEGQNDRSASARLTADLGAALVRTFRVEQAVERLAEALAVVDGGEPDPDAARLAAALGKAYFFIGQPRAALPHIETALTYAEALQLPDVLARALEARGLATYALNRYAEARINLAASVEVAERNALVGEADTAQGNLAELSLQTDAPEAGAESIESLAFARRLGNRYAESIVLFNLSSLHVLRGDWHHARRLVAEPLADDRPGADFLHLRLALIDALEGNVDSARQHVSKLMPLISGDEVEKRGMGYAAFAAVALAEGDYRTALEQAEKALDDGVHLGIVNEAVRQAWPDALDAALALTEFDTASRLLALVADRPPGHVPGYLRAQLIRYRALVAAAQGSSANVEADLRAALEAFRDLGYRFWIARALLDLGGWLADHGSPDAAGPLVGEAVEIFTALGAEPWRLRAEDRRIAHPVAVPALTEADGEVQAP